jgi:hypothetical protein
MYFRELRRQMKAAQLEIPIETVSLSEEMQKSKQAT